MLNSLLEGFLLGLGAAVPLGPINILIMNHALKSYKSAVCIGLGAMSADMIYLLLILLGVATVFNNALFMLGLGLLGSFFLAYMAYSIFSSRHNHLDKVEQVASEKSVSIKSLMKYYFQGLVLTGLNPYTIAFWLSIAGYTVNQNLNPIFTVVGMFCAILLWIMLMPYFVHKSKHKISAKISYYISMGSSVVLGFFALSLLINLFKEIL
ncbi:MAG: Transporter, LysE family [uncultured Sulfurovum sp.]|uniref:Transporter, LysE family n=1 Tax=uncultured Sulfurovum sp. TaxID=269237 RepID=A0A6S6TF70_9BACT|nr:MAG: Transporter, LysE family [uncultured Sulfurovum sp.]